MKTPIGTPAGPIDWQRVKELFHSALERDPATRGDYLDQACNGDPDLRREVESLIAAHGQVGSFIEEPAGTPEHGRPNRTDRHSALPAGFHLGPYELVELLGTGGMGEVYRARDPRLGREVALKVVPSDLAGDPERRERFLREARMVSALNHPNICTIHEIGSAGGLDYICFEYIEGPTLATLLEGAVLSFERLLELATPLAEALAYAHGKGILHRDLKPANIMVSERGPKILDFGLAKIVAAAGESARDPSLTDAGLVMGTAAYMSPEQALGRKVDERSDIFSLGAVLYEMASGTQAFAGSVPTEVIDAVLHHQPAPLARLRPELPAELSLVVEKALRKDAAERYPHTADLAADLRRLGESGAPRLIAGGRRKGVRIRFGDCTLDTDSRELLRDGQPVHVTGKAFQLLEMLVENAPKALSKDTLQNSLWPDVLVTESNLANLVTELRRALGDDARTPKFIRTVHGFGYAFCGEVAETGAVAPTPRGAGVSRYRLVWSHKEIVLAEGENILGRGPESLEWIDHDTVSRRHARIVISGAKATLEDLGSKNGTYLGGRLVERATPLADGDEIRLGSVPLKLKVLAEPGSTSTRSRARR